MFMRPVLILGLLSISCLDAQAESSAERGHAVVEQWCRLCHLHADDPPDPDMAPPFEVLVTWPGRDRAHFQAFLREDHFPMTTFRLFDREKAEVVDYLMALKRGAAN